MISGNGEYGRAAGEDTVWCVRRKGSPVFLCGRQVGYMPHEQPHAPTKIHAACLAALAKVSRPSSGSYGVCPVCEGSVPVHGGKVGQHGRWSWEPNGGVTVSDELCSGRGRWPGSGRR